MGDVDARDVGLADIAKWSAGGVGCGWKGFLLGIFCVGESPAGPATHRFQGRSGPAFVLFDWGPENLLGGTSGASIGLH